jgi:hypothetical protein
MEELIGAANEVGASRIVLGHPTDEERLPHLEELAQHVAEETGIPVSILP